MLLFNKILSKIDLAIVKRSRITRVEKGLKQAKKELHKVKNELHKVKSELHQMREEAEEIIRSSKAISLEDRLRTIPLWRSTGFPSHQTQILMIIYKKDLNKIAELMAGHPQARLEHIAVVDADASCLPRVPFTDKNGTRSVPVSNLESITQHLDLECIFFQPEFDYSEWMQLIEVLHKQRIQATYLNAAPIDLDSPYLPHHYKTWQCQFTMAYAMLEDMDSRQTLAHIIKARTTGNPGYYYMSAYAKDFHPSTQVCPGDTVFDASINPIPETIKTFSKITGEKGRVFAFESLATCYTTAGRHLTDCDNVILLPLGLERNDDLLNFRQNHDPSKLTHEGDMNSSIKASIPTVDIVMSQILVDKLDFLKMDANGAEIATLLGAEQSLRRHKPNLAICVYNNPTDIFEVPAFINSLGLGYRMYLGHHSASKNGTILYASARQ